MSAMRPAEITFPSHVNTILIVDRTKFKKGAVNIIESVLTGETPGEDKSGMQALVSAFQQKMATSPRFQVKIASERLTGNSVTAAFPDPVKWTELERLLRRYQADVAVVIELFDTDFIVTDGMRKVTKEIEEDGVKKEIEVDQHYAEGIGNATIGLRVYDPGSKTIVDQQLFKETNTWEATGESVRDALASLTAKSDATRYLSAQVGKNYAYKIAPMPVRISRRFYSKSKKIPEMSHGSRLADVNNWEDAINVWERGLDKANTKEAGYLSYNIAIAYEVLGDFKKAKAWADRAYVQYGNKDARSYANQLMRRMQDEVLVDEQMK